jgi:hypothetical protein
MTLLAASGGMARQAAFAAPHAAAWQRCHAGQPRRARQVWTRVCRAAGVLDRQTYQGGTRGSRLCGEDRDRETENSKVCARTRDTRFIQFRVAKMASPTSCLGDQVWHPALGVG